jgi:hypothetical protein
VYFSGVTFSEKVTFWGTEGNPVFVPGAWARFDSVQIEKPELLTFNTVLLHPGWFINADVRKVDFTDVKWYGMPGGPKGTLDEELSTLEEHKVEARHTLWVCPVYTDSLPLSHSTSSQSNLLVL